MAPAWRWNGHVGCSDVAKLVLEWRFERRDGHVLGKLSKNTRQESGNVAKIYENGSNMFQNESQLISGPSKSPCSAYKPQWSFRIPKRTIPKQTIPERSIVFRSQQTNVFRLQDQMAVSHAQTSKRETGDGDDVDNTATAISPAMIAMSTATTMTRKTTSQPKWL